MRQESDRRVEYLTKKANYLFPPQTKIFLNSNRLSVQLISKKTTSLNQFLQKTAPPKRGYPYKIGLPITGTGSNLFKEYTSILSYFEKKSKLDFLSFEHATSEQLPLCTFFKSTDLQKTTVLLADINKELPFLENIFARPLIHLKETDIVQPVDAVKRVDHNTIRHLSQHTENWKDVSGSTLIPSRLLTRVYDDDYSIYENIVFRDLVDKFTNYLRKKIYALSEILDTFKESIQLDAVNRLNHPKYYLAIGKLYVGFYRMENSSEIPALLEAAKALYTKLNNNKSKRIYTMNRRVKPITGHIKKTNILTMHKDYRHVYSLYQKFNKNTVELQESGSVSAQNKSQQAYELFCQMLTMFATSNFNTTCNTLGTLYEDGVTEATFECGNWNISVRSEYNEILDLNTLVVVTSTKTSSFKMLLLPLSFYLGGERADTYQWILERLAQGGCKYDKYIFFEPFDYDDYEVINDYNLFLNLPEPSTALSYAILPISICDVNSFRRIQKLLLESMIKSSQSDNYTICAFCGEKHLITIDNKAVCPKCRTAVKKITCHACKQDFVASFIDIKTKKSKDEQAQADYLKHMHSFFKYEKLHSFRNITNMTESAIICPHCNAETLKA